MGLRELKREAQQLPSIKEQVEKLQQESIKTLHSLAGEVREKETALQVKGLGKQLQNLAFFQSINDKLNFQARQLVELKLSEFTQDKAKARVIVHRLLKDDFFNLPQTILDIKLFEQEIKLVQENFRNLQSFLNENLSLEHSLVFEHISLPKKLQELSNLASQQKSLAKSIGKEFVIMAKKVEGKNKR